jgi:hypothetical protein
VEKSSLTVLWGVKHKTRKKSSIKGVQYCTVASGRIVIYPEITT